MKNAVTKAEPRMIDIIPPGQQMDAAARINYFHTLSKQAGEVAVKAALYAGMELFKAKIDHTGAFDAWVDQNCAFGRRTAYNYLSLLTETVGKGVDLVGLAEGTDDARTDAIAEYAGNMEPKGLTELYVDLGIVKKSKSNLGGKREGAGRPRKQSAEELAKQAEEVAKHAAGAETLDLAAKLYNAAVLQGGLGELEDDQLKSVCETAEQIASKAGVIIKSRRSKTLAEAFKKER